MRKIIASEFYTLDGLMSDPEDKMEWVLGSFNDEMGKYEVDLYDSADTLLPGRTTYKIFEGYWPTAASNPATSQGDIEMARMENFKLLKKKEDNKFNCQSYKLIYKHHLCAGL